MASDLWITTGKKIRKTGALFLCLLLLCASALSDCKYKGPQYTEEEALEREELGAVIMEEWMWKYYPEGEVKETWPHIFYYPSGPSYLTEYVEGEMYDGVREREFAVNIRTEDVLLEADEDMQAFFSACARSLYLTSLGLPLDTEIEGFDAYIGYDVGSLAGNEKKESLYTSACLPGELVAERGAVESYVNDSSRNGVICVSGHINAGNDTDIGAYGLEDLIDRQERFRVSYSAFGMSNAYERLTINRYERCEFVEWEGRTAFALAENREERTLSDGRIERETEKPEINNIAVLKKEESAYVIEFSETTDLCYFELYVQEGDELLENEYTAVTGLGKGETRLEDKLTWRADENGLGLTLCRSDGSRYSFHRTTRLKIRDSRGTAGGGKQ